jgi:activated CDC42 kinase 1
MMNDLDAYKILEDIQLEQFWPKLRDNLQITRLSHFNYAKAKDFEKIGISKPAIRRLMDYVNHLKTNNSTTNSSNQILMIKDSDLKISRCTPDKVYLKNSSSSLKQAVSIRKTSIKLNQQTFNDLRNINKLSHDNLVKFFGIKINPNTQLSIISEYVPMGTLKDFLAKQRDRLLVSLLHSFVCQICQGMEYLELKKMIHKTLILENIYVFNHDKVKIGNIESINALNNYEDLCTIESISKNLENLYAPETLKTKKFSIKANVWLFGILIWELFMFGDRILNIHSSLTQIEKPNACSEEMFFLIQKCLSYLPRKRPHFKDLINFVKNATPIRMKAKMRFNQTSKLEIERNDTIIIIDGLYKLHYF